MGQIYLKDQDGLTRAFTIAGTTPTATEQERITNILIGKPMTPEPQTTDWDNMGIMSAFASGTMAGANQMQAGTDALIGGQDWEKDRQRQNQEAESYAHPEGGPFDQNGIYGLSKYLAYQLGNSSPSMAAAIPGAMVGGSLGSIVPVVGTGIGSVVGGIIGAATASLPQSYNENLDEQVQKYGFVKDREKAFKAALAQSALEGTADRVFMGMGRVVPATIKGVFSEAIKGGLKKAAAKVGEDVVVGMSTEGATEAAQQALTRWQAEKPLGDAEAIKEYLENAFVGSLLGGPTAGVFGTVGAIQDAKETAKKETIKADLDAENNSLYGTNTTDNLSTNIQNIQDRAKNTILAEDAFPADNTPLLEDNRPGPVGPLLTGPNAVKFPVAVEGASSSVEGGGLATTPSASKDRLPFSEEEYINAVDKMRGEKNFSSDKIKKMLGIGRAKANHIYDEIIKRGDGSVQSGKYPSIITKATAPDETKTDIKRRYQTKEIPDTAVAPFNIKVQGGRQLQTDFKTAEDARDFAEKQGITDYVVTENKTPKKYGVYEVTSGIEGNKPTGRLIKTFGADAEAKSYANGLNPDYAPATNEKIAETDQTERINARVKAIVGEYQKPIQTLVDRMLGPGKTAVDLVAQINDPSGKGNFIEGVALPGVQDGMRRIAVSFGGLNPNLSPDERANALNGIAHHEVLHVAKAAGLFTPKEYNALRNRANQKISGKNYSYIERAQVRTDGAPKGATLEEEAIAEMFRDYMKNPAAFDQANRSILKKLIDFIKSLGGLMNDNLKGGDVLNALSSGALATRGPVSRETMYGPYYSSVKIPGFYSATADYFEKIAQQNPDQVYQGAQWLGSLKNAKGIKQEELDWLGLPDWLRNQQKVSVRNILEFIGANSVDIKEQTFKNMPARLKAERNNLENELIQSYRDDYGYESFTDWMDFQADNYTSNRDSILELRDIDAKIKEAEQSQPHHEFTTQTGGEDYTEFVFHMPHLQPVFSIGGHFDGFPNIIAHARLKTRTIDGKKTLFIEEMQSDLHQRGKKQGYSSAPDVQKINELNEEYAALGREKRSIIKDIGDRDLNAEEEIAWQKISDRQLEIGEQLRELEKISDIPDAPLKTAWSDFVIKRLVRHASENGFDAITWNAEPEGVAQSEKYGELTHLVDEEDKDIYKVGDPNYQQQDVTGIINFYTKRLRNDINKLFNKAEFGNPSPRIIPRVESSAADLNLEELFPEIHDFMMVMGEVGQFEPDMAKWTKKAMQAAKAQRTFDPMAAMVAADMPIGRFTDIFNQMYPEYAVEETATATVDKAGNPNLARWALDITPELKETALGKGFPMFSSVKLKADPKTIENPAFKRWFSGSKVVGDDGKPLILYHGTLKDFEAFGKAHPKGFAGAGIYFTDTPQDASEGYATIGNSDFLARVDQIVDARINDYQDEDMNYDDVYNEVKNELMDHRGAVIPAFMAIKRPYIIGGDNETQFDAGMRQRFVDALGAVSRDFLNVDPDYVSEEFHDRYDDDELLGGSDFRQAAVNSRGISYAIDPETGMDVAPEVWRKTIQSMGFDGIIDRLAGRRWRGMPGVAPATTHYIAFRPTQVKSPYNNGNFSEEDTRILFSSIKPSYSAAGAMGTRVPMQAPARTLADIEARTTYNTVAPKLEKLFGYVLHKDTAKSLAEGTIIGLQDKYQPLAKLIDRVRANGGALSNESDTYLREQLMHGEIDVQITNNEKKLYDPIIGAVQKLNVTKRDIDELKARHPSSMRPDPNSGLPREASAVQNILSNYPDPKMAMAELYLYAQHARERNALMRERNSELMGERPDQFDNGSGMTDFEAQDVLNWIGTKPFGRDLMDLSNPTSIRSLFRKLISNTNDIRVEGNLNPDFRTMTREDGTPVDRYQDYAPIRGYLDENPDHMNDELANAFARAGKGMKIMGKEDFAATGRRDEGANIIGNAVLQNMEAITRAGKNRVGLSFLKMLEDNMGVTMPTSPGQLPNTVSDFAEVVPLTKPKATYNRRTGRVVMSEQSVKMDPNIMVVKRGGEEIGINIKDPKLRAAFLGNSMLGTTGQSALVKGLLRLNRFLAAARTSYNPEFMFSNVIRDLEAAALNLSEIEIKGLRTDVVKSALPAVRGVYRALRDRDINDPWMKEFQEFAQHGGKTAFMGIRDLDGTLERMTKKLSTDPNGNFQKSWEAVKSVGEYIETVNDSFENGTRVAAYKHVKDRLMAMSRNPQADAERIKSRAAFIAKNLTVNFNMGGTQKPLMQSLYLFYNASLQGTFALVNPLIRSKRVRQFWLAAIAGGVLQDALMQMLSAVGDDGQSEYDKIPEQVLGTNIILPNPFSDRGYIKIPMPYVFNAAWNAGRAFSRTVRGGYTIGEGMGNVMGGLAEAVNPWGGGGTFLNFVAPTIMDPMVDLATNTNFMGSPIAPPENPYASGKEIPAQKFWNNTSPIYTTVADLVDTLTGGDNVLPGKMSFSPNQYEYVFEYFGGGAWSTIVRASDMLNPVDGNAKKLLTGDEVSTNDIPFVRRFMGNLTSREDLTGYIEKRDEILAVRNAMKDALKNGDTATYQSIMQRYPNEYKIASRINAIESNRRKLGGQINRIRDNKSIPDAEKKRMIDGLKERQEALVNQANALMGAN